MSEGNEPWADVDTPLARAFRNAFQRSRSMADDDDTDITYTEGRSDRALMLIGTDLDPDELQEYINGLGVAYGQLILEALGFSAETLDRELDVEDIDRHSVELTREEIGHMLVLLRGMSITSALVGDFHARERARSDAIIPERPGETVYVPPGILAEPDPRQWRPVSDAELRGDLVIKLDVGEKPDALAVAVPAEQRTPTMAQWRELATDLPQTVLDLEADRLERMATSVQVLGLGDVAAYMRAASIALRTALSLQANRYERHHSGMHSEKRDPKCPWCEGVPPVDERDA